jgi:hypothetical protein
VERGGGREKRKDAQLAREVEFSIPREMNEKQGVASPAISWKRSSSARNGRRPQCALGQGEGWQPKPHAHVMLSMREVGPGGFRPEGARLERAEL